MRKNRRQPRKFETKAESAGIQSKTSRRTQNDLDERNRSAATLTRRIPYPNLRKAIRKVLTEHLDKNSGGRAICVDKGGANDPIRIEVVVPQGPPIRPEIRLTPEFIAVSLNDLQISDYAAIPDELRGMLQATSISIGGPILRATASIVGDVVHLNPIEIPYNRLRSVLYFACKKFLPEIANKYVDATFEFDDADGRVRFSGTKTPLAKFEGDLVFGEDHALLQVSLGRLASFLKPLAKVPLDSVLSQWTDGWDEVPSA